MSKKCDLGITKDYRGITHTFIAVKFSKKSIYNTPSNRRWTSCKTSRGNTIVCRYPPGIWFHTQRKDGKILLAYGLPKEIVSITMMLHRKTKVNVRSSSGHIEFDIVAGVQQRDTLAPKQYRYTSLKDFKHVHMTTSCLLTKILLRDMMKGDLLFGIITLAAHTLLQ